MKGKTYRTYPGGKFTSERVALSKWEIEELEWGENVKCGLPDAYKQVRNVFE